MMKQSYYYISRGENLTFAEDLAAFELGTFVKARLGYTRLVTAAELVAKANALEREGFTVDILLGKAAR